MNYIDWEYNAPEPEPTDAEIEDAWIDAIEQEAAAHDSPDFSYEMMVDARWEKEAA